MKNIEEKGSNYSARYCHSPLREAFVAKSQEKQSLYFVQGDSG